MVDETEVEAAPETGVDQTPQGTETPVAGAGQQKSSAKNGDQTPAEGETSAAVNGEQGKEPMIPKSRLDEESRKVQTLTRRMKELEAIDGRLKSIGQRFGRDSQSYLDELERFYAAQEQGNRTPPQPEDRISRLEKDLDQMRETERIRVERGKIEVELNSVRDNPRYSVLKGGWEKWSKVILGRMSADLDMSADDIATEIVELLNATKADYVKTKTEEGKRYVESGGGGTPPGRKEEKFTKLKDLERMVDTVVKGARNRPQE